MEKAKITFKSGLEIEAEIRGLNLIIDEKITFPAIGGVTVATDDTEIVYYHPELIECTGTDDRYWFMFKELPAEKIALEQLRADLDYACMEAGIEL